MIQKSIKHLQENNESYYEHQQFAFRYGWGCLRAGLMASAHGLISTFFTADASDLVKSLANRSRHPLTPRHNEHK